MAEASRGDDDLGDRLQRAQWNSLALGGLGKVVKSISSPGVVFGSYRSKPGYRFCCTSFVLGFELVFQFGFHLDLVWFPIRCWVLIRKEHGNQVAITRKPSGGYLENI